jgi:hypothetical protein
MRSPPPSGSGLDELTEVLRRIRARFRGTTELAPVHGVVGHRSSTHLLCPPRGRWRTSAHTWWKFCILTRACSPARHGSSTLPGPSRRWGAARHWSGVHRRKERGKWIKVMWALHVWIEPARSSVRSFPSGQV